MSMISAKVKKVYSYADSDYPDSDKTYSMLYPELGIPLRMFHDDKNFLQTSNVLGISNAAGRTICLPSNMPATMIDLSKFDGIKQEDMFVVTKNSVYLLQEVKEVTNEQF